MYKKIQKGENCIFGRNEQNYNIFSNSFLFFPFFFPYFLTPLFSSISPTLTFLNYYLFFQSDTSANRGIGGQIYALLVQVGCHWSQRKRHTSQSWGLYHHDHSHGSPQQPTHHHCLHNTILTFPTFTSSKFLLINPSPPPFSFTQVLISPHLPCLP